MKDRYRAKKLLNIGVSSIAIAYFLTVVAGRWVKFGINSSNSIPGSLFLIIKGSKLERDDLVAFYPPKNPYYNTWFVKYVAGIPGDIISSSGRSFFINGKYIGKAKQYSKSGNILKQSSPGMVSNESYFVWTPHKDSYDSRYKDIGLIGTDRVIGRAIRIL